MTVFKHKTLPLTISYDDWNKLSPTDKIQFEMVAATSKTVVNNKTEITDLLGIGKVAETVVAVPLVIVGGIFGLFD